MESFSKFASRFEKNLNLNRGTSRDTTDRSRFDRDYAERRRIVKDQVSIDQIRETVGDLNNDQLDVIQDLFYDERIDRESSGKEILRAVDNNSKLLNKNYRMLSDLKDEVISEEKPDYDHIIDILDTLKEELIDKREADKKEKTDNIFDKSTAEKAFIDLEDHVHNENVKCYKNVQAAIAEQDEQTYAKISKSMGTLKALTITAIAFGLLNLIFMICQYLHLI
jgi:hypothetical protein